MSMRLGSLIVCMALISSVIRALVVAGPIEATAHSAVRSISSGWTAPGAELVITISVSGYGGIGQVAEVLPDGFSYKDSSLDAVAVRVDGQTVQFTLLGEAQFSYTVTAAVDEGSFEISGVFKDANKDEVAVAGQFEVIVSETPPPTPTPTPTPVLTPTPELTTTPTPTPTLTASPETEVAAESTPTGIPTPTPVAGSDGSPTPTSTTDAETSLTMTPTSTATVVVGEESASMISTPAPTPTGVSPSTARETLETEGGVPVWVVYATVAVGAFGAGAGAMYLVMRRRTS